MKLNFPCGGGGWVAGSNGSKKKKNNSTSIENEIEIDWRLSLAKHGHIFSRHTVPGIWQVFKTSIEDVKQPAIYLEKTFDLSLLPSSASTQLNSTSISIEAELYFQFQRSHP